MLRSHMKDVVNHAWAPRTKRRLSSQAKAFKTFAAAAGIVSLPLSGEEICWYAIWLWIVRKLKAPKSIQMYLSAVRTLHRKVGLDCATPSSYGPLGNVMSGLKRKLQHRVKKMSPITPTILVNLVKSVPLTPMCPIIQQTLVVLRILALLFFQTMLRGSNMIPENRHDYDHRYILKWSNIEKVDYGLLVTVTHSKTIQYGERQHQIPLAASPDPKLCPVRALTTLARMYGPEYVKPQNPVFLVPTPSGAFVPIKKSEFLGWLRARPTGMGLKASDYGVHSFRHGAVQEALLNESNKALVQLASDHSSEAIMGYAQIPPARRMALSAKVNQSLARLCTANNI